MSHENFNTLNNHEEIFDLIDKEFLQLYFYQGDVYETDAQIENFFNLGHKDLETLRTIHFFLSPKVSSLIRSLPVLLRNLSHSTYHEDEEMKGHIRGMINWNNTFKTRLSSGYNDKSLFVCSLSNKNYNLEENQLLKFLLKKIIQLKEHNLPFANPSKYEFDFERIDEDKDWYKKVRNYYEVCKRTLKKVYFDDIDDLNKISHKHLKKTANHKNIVYSKIVFEVYKLYVKLFIDKDPTVLFDLMKQRIIKSRDSNKLFELYIFSEFINASSCTMEYKLLHAKNGGNSIELEYDGGVQASVHYQYTPDDLEKNSKYKKICENYSIGYNVRAPDIILEFKDSNTYRLFEVKNTDDENYIRESIYKVMGYLKDFEGDENESYLTTKYPIILITFGGIKQKNIIWEDEDIIICNKDEFIKYLKDGVFFND